MKTYKDIYKKVVSFINLVKAYKNARKGKTKKRYVKEFHKDLRENLLKLREELLNKIYQPKPLITFILRDPKTRRISKSAFRDRIVHHAIINVIEPIFDKGFIYDSCANRIGRGSLFALNRFEEFKRKVNKNNTHGGYVLKADVKHYFDEINHNVLLGIIKNKIVDEELIGLIKLILNNYKFVTSGKGMPLGNLTSQFLANVYLNELDYFIKHELKIKYYIRYVDDFVIFHSSRTQLEIWKKEIDNFLREKLKIELHPQKTKIISLSRGVDFVGFRNFYHHRLLRKRNIRNIKRKIQYFKDGLIDTDKFAEIWQGWNAYAKWANTYKLRLELLRNYSNPPTTNILNSPLIPEINKKLVA